MPPSVTKIHTQMHEGLEHVALDDPQSSHDKRSMLFKGATGYINLKNSQLAALTSRIQSSFES
jgi:hypothetical protein